MRKVLCLLLLFCFLQSEAKRVPATVVIQGKTLSLMLEVPTKAFGSKPNFRKLQRSFTCYDQEGRQLIFRPSGGAELTFTWDTITVKMVPLSNLPALGGLPHPKQLFLLLVKDGRLRMYSYHYLKIPIIYAPTPYSINSHISGVKGGRRDIFQKGSGEYKIPYNITFRNDMMEYFSDCPAVRNKIESREFKKADMPLIADMYNADCWK